MKLNDLDLDKIIVALDGIDYIYANAVIHEMKSKVAGFKVNHILYNKIDKDGVNIFADYKLHDIPSVVRQIVESLIRDKTDMVTVHTRVQPSLFAELRFACDRIKLLGVTVLTSMSEYVHERLYGKTISQSFEYSIGVMEGANFFGAICAPTDLEYFKGSTLKRICPGIVLPGDLHHDQSRISTPDDALANGADYLVMGRGFMKLFEEAYGTKAI